MKPPVDTILAPPFPKGADWLNVATLRMDQQRGRPVLIEFWDFCRPNSLRTLPYLRAWHERYAEHGLRVIGVHAPGFPPSADPENVARAVERLEIAYPVMLDPEFVFWQEYENLGWPARYLWNGDGILDEYHYGEGDYAGTERAIQALLGLDPETHPTVEPLRPEDVPGARLIPQSDDVEGPHDGPYEAGSVWGVFDGAGTVSAFDGPAGVAATATAVPIDGPGAYELLRHEHATAGELHLELSDGVRCLATCFLPGLAPESA